MTMNPFDPTFGSIPDLLLDYRPRAEQFVDDLAMAKTPQTWFITGVRGAGKSVYMNVIGEELRKRQPRWLVVRTSNVDNLFERLYENLVTPLVSYDVSELSVLGLKITKRHPQTEEEFRAAITTILHNWGRLLKNARIVILLDEASNTPALKRFTTAWNEWKADNLPVHLLMTGLPKEVNDLSGDANLTFLLRASRYYMQPLAFSSIVETYTQVFGDEHLAIKLAKMTNGYEFAFQLLGSLTYQALQTQVSHGVVERVKPAYQQRLFDQAYIENVKNLRSGTREYLQAVATNNGETAAIVAELGISRQAVNNYRRRLINYGLIYPVTKGQVAFTLPYFAEFLRQDNDAGGVPCYNWSYGDGSSLGM